MADEKRTGADKAPEAPKPVKVTLTLNLGTDDRRRCGLSPEQAQDGKVVEVDKASADFLISKGWASPVVK